MPVRTYPLTGSLDLRRTLAPLARGRYDPTIRLAVGRAWRATRTLDGPATIALAIEGDQLRAEAWGPGAERALEGVPALVGVVEPLPPIVAGHPRVRQLARHYPGVRIPRSEAVLESLVPAILEQKVTGEAARRAMYRLIAAHGEPAPGPPELRLRLWPTPATMAALPYYAYHPYGVERRRADLIRRVAAQADWFEAIVGLPLPDAYARLTAIPGIGPWTAAEVGVRALAGEPRADDTRMLELLEPYRGQRALVIRLLEVSGMWAPKYGPRLSIRRFEQD
jgi:3-methyladenine DNA glycosylase/8-oxoguanine DNA glycosylase